MRLTFDINEYDKVYDALIGILGFEQECFQTDDVIEIYEEDLEVVRNILPDVEFKKINNTLGDKINEAEQKTSSKTELLKEELPFDR